MRRFIAVIERAVILAMSDALELRALPVQMWIRIEPVTLAERERDQILRALENSGWVVGGASGAAARLGVPRTTLVDKMRGTDFRVRQYLVDPSARMAFAPFLQAHVPSPAFGYAKCIRAETGAPR